MKKFILLSMMLMLLGLNGASQTVKLVISSNDTTLVDTLMTDATMDIDADLKVDDLDTILGDDANNIEITVGAISILFFLTIFGLPLLIIIIMQWFRYKNKQARYRLISEALAQGQDVSKELQQINEPHQEILIKGIKNIFLGIGLGVFLWILTDSEGLAAIGFLISCLGLGQVVISYVTRPKTDKKETE